MQNHEVELARFWTRDVTQRWGTELRALVAADQQNFSSRLRQSIQNLLAQANPIWAIFFKSDSSRKSLAARRRKYPRLEAFHFCFVGLGLCCFQNFTQ